MDDPFIRQYVEDLLRKIRTQVRSPAGGRGSEQGDQALGAGVNRADGVMHALKPSCMAAG
jgi:hypothetical protein